MLHGKNLCVRSGAEDIGKPHLRDFNLGLETSLISGLLTIGYVNTKWVLK
jgi:hypothetical protein